MKISVISATDKVTTKDWYDGRSSHVESIMAGGMELQDTYVAKLVQAMAHFTPPPLGQTTLTAGQQAQLEPVIAANWHAAA